MNSKFFRYKTFWSVVLFAVLAFSAKGESLSDSSRWQIIGESRVEIEESTLDRLISDEKKGDQRRFGDRMVISMKDAILKPMGDLVGEELKLDLTIEIDVGNTMELSDGLITKIENVTAQIQIEDTGRQVDLRMSERGNVIAKLKHADSVGPNHLAFDIPFSLYDVTTGLLVGENRMYGLPTVLMTLRTLKMRPVQMPLG